MNASPEEMTAPASAQVAPAAEQDVPAHKRRRCRSDFTDDATGVPFFDEARVPVVTIEVPNPETQGLSAEQIAQLYEVVGQKVSHRLAQRPGANVVLKYVRTVIKQRDTQTLHCPPAPAGVIQGSRADVSFIVGVTLDKFQWHLPLYRQHQRLIEAGFKLSRPWLTQIVSQAAQLLEPIYNAQLESIRRSRVLAMDETPIKAGRCTVSTTKCASRSSSHASMPASKSCWETSGQTMRCCSATAMQPTAATPRLPA